MTKYEEALKKYRQAERECLAELFAESCLEGEDPHVTDDSGCPLTREEVYQKLLNGDLN